MNFSNIKIIDMTKKINHEKYLHKCLSLLLFMKYGEL